MKKKKIFFYVKFTFFFQKLQRHVLISDFSLSPCIKILEGIVAFLRKPIIESFKNHKNTITAFTKNVSLETKPMGTSTLDQVRKKGYFLKDRFREWKKVFKQLLLSDYCEIKRPYPLNQYYQLTVWNSQNFSAIKILREISFDGFKNVKKLEMLKFHHFLTLRFYVKSIFGILEVQNLLFQHI